VLGKIFLHQNLAMLVGEIVGFVGDIDYDIRRPNGTPKKARGYCKVKFTRAASKDISSGWYSANLSMVSRRSVTLFSTIGVFN